MTQYPEHAKMAAVQVEAQAVGEFLDQSPYVLARWSGERLVPVTASIEQVLAEWFSIDLAKVEDEKRQMLARAAGQP